MNFFLGVNCIPNDSIIKLRKISNQRDFKARCVGNEKTIRYAPLQLEVES